jgi:hypothetical protein
MEATPVAVSWSIVFTNVAFVGFAYPVTTAAVPLVPVTTV